MAEMSSVEKKVCPCAGAIFGIGNPLLDISAVVDDAYLEKYNLKVNTACLAGPEHLPIFEELAGMTSVQYIAGGATQNSIRVAQWMLQCPGTTVYSGCVGKDKFGGTLRQCAEADGVAVHYLEDATTPTGTCAVLINKKDRCLVANLASANCYKIDHLMRPEMQAIWKNAKVYYTAGFFLTVSPPSAMAIAQHSHDTGKIFMTNLSAPFICQFFKEPLLQILPLTDIVFGNESECLAFGQSMGYEDLSLEAIGLKMAAIPKLNAARPRTVVITQGSKTTMVIYNGQIAHFSVPHIDKEKIVDCNGAGDAFVGGFISQISLGKPIFDCVRAGHYAAGYIIQVSGTSLTGVPNFQ